MAFLLRQRRALYACACTTVAALTTATLTAAGPAAASAGDGRYVSFVDAHFYPFFSGGSDYGLFTSSAPPVAETSY